MEIELHAPFSESDLLSLHAGDRVFLCGTVYTARDQAHKRIAEAIENGAPLPFDLQGSAIYYVGPTPSGPDRIIGSAGPTTACRMDAYSPLLLDHGNRVMIGKGSRGEAVKEAIIRNRAVYLAAAGGCGALLSSCVRSCRLIAYEDLGCEAIRALTVERMPLTVAIDSYGNDLFFLGPQSYRKECQYD